MFDLTAGTIERPFRDKHASADGAFGCGACRDRRQYRVGRAVLGHRHFRKCRR